MKNCLATLIITLALSATGWAQSTVTVMSRNMYSGIDLAPLTSATTLLQAMNGWGEVFNRVNATDFRIRAGRIAGEIAATQPALVGVQEAALWRTQSPADGPLTAATTVRYDFLQILQLELLARGQPYQVVAIFNGFNIEAPARIGTQIIDVRFTDRIAILRRVNINMTLSNVQVKQFNVNASMVSLLTGGLPYRRGWLSVDATIGNRKFRFINTHLEVLSAPVRRAQLQEILAGPSRPIPAIPVILVGDMNFAPNDPTSNLYAMTIAAGFRDAWRTLLPLDPGPTCCQDANLRNLVSKLFTRIDYIFARGNAVPLVVFRVGHRPIDRTLNGLWPSDHAGVVARLRLP